MCRAHVPSEARSMRGRSSCRPSRSRCPRPSSTSRRIRCRACLCRQCRYRRRLLAARVSRLPRRGRVAGPSSKATACARQQPTAATPEIGPVATRNLNKLGAERSQAVHVVQRRQRAPVVRSPAENKTVYTSEDRTTLHDNPTAAGLLRSLTQISI